MDFGYSGYEASEAYAIAHPGLLGDPYPEGDRVCRSVAWAVGSEVPQFNYALDSNIGCLGELFATSMDTADPRKTGELSSSKTTVVEHFAQHDLPPQLPRDPLFQLETTTLHMNAEPFHLGNTLLEFLRTGVDSMDLRVNHRKFSIKAGVLYRGSTCSVKLRVYQVARRSYAVEFQRRQGDCVAFMRLFSELARHLQRDPHCHAASDMPMDQELEPQVAPCLNTEDLFPLLDMAGQGKMLPAEVLADVASALARMAYDYQVAALLCTDSVVVALANLVQADRESVALPAAEALRRLAGRQGAGGLPVGHILEEVVRDRLHRTAPAPSDALGHELERALRVAAPAQPPAKRA